MLTGRLLNNEGGEVVTFLGWYDDTYLLYYLFSHDMSWGIFDVGVNDWKQYTDCNRGSTDRDAVSAAYNLSPTQEYTSAELGMNSFDDAGAFAWANVHNDAEPANALWDGSQFYFGDDHWAYIGPTAVLDIVAMNTAMP